MATRILRRRSLYLACLSALLGLALSACATEADLAPTGEGNDFPLSDYDAISEGVPPNEMLPSEGKADATYPARFDLAAQQSPIRNQARRGACTIFSTTALMEHLYIAEGTITQPDFSEQYLQWSVKSQLGRFANTEGSNNSYNLEAISRFGIPVESAWPYESDPWSTNNDPACEGESRPTRCWTNGEPPASARSSQLFKLPNGRYINSNTESVKAHIFTKRTAAVAGVDFYYQSWNHRGSMLPVNNEAFAQGYVLYPNQEDIADSRARRAGHGILLVGWDDELEVPMRDKNGETVRDASGNEMKERGFFLFKNSWGTGRFGVNNPKGDGYGWISYRYIAEFGNVYVSDLPRVERPREVCTGGVDEDTDGQIDCSDTDCAMDAACVAPPPGGGETTMHSNTTATDIPDNNTTGIRSDIVVAQAGRIKALSVAVDITHPYRGDLVVALVKDGREIKLLDKVGAGDDNVRQTFDVRDFDGTEAGATYTLVVRDTARSDVGRLNSWSMTVVRCGATDCGGAPPAEVSYDRAPAAQIPDADRRGVTDEITITDAGAIRRLRVGVEIAHTYRGDLTITLQKVGGRKVTLLRADGRDQDDVRQTFEVADFVSTDAAGTWRLVVTDDAGGDVGTLESWRMLVTR